MGSQTEAPVALQWYFRYLFLLSLNGTTEAFAKSLMSVSEMFYHSFYLILCFGGFATAISLFSTSLRTIICANGVNMILRILWNVWFLLKKFNFKFLLGCIPQMGMMVSCGGLSLVAYL